MRTLCLNLHQAQEASCAEIFLKFSPRVQFRYPHYVFVDIDSTAGLFGGELKLLKLALEMARSFSPQVTAAIADSAAFAQVLSHFRPFEITIPHQDIEMLKSLSVLALTEMEGLKPWPRLRQIEHIIDFFQSLGMKTIDDILSFDLNSFRERWGDSGIHIWKRLHQQEAQVISPLVPQDPLSHYAYFDDPVDHTKILFQKLNPSLDYLFMRLDGLGRFAQSISLTLFCEYSDKKINITVEPVSPSRDKQLFLDLLSKRLEKVELENPVREFEVQIYDVPEKIQQLDFLEPRDKTEDRWRRLISFIHQAECEAGFLQLEASHFPEESYSLQTDWPRDFSPKDLVERMENAIQIKSVHAKALAKSPRPSLLLQEPLALSRIAVDKLQVMSRFPSERIESSWWKSFRADKTELKNRDYYFALSREGQLLWIFKDRESESYYLHGYFD